MAGTPVPDSRNTIYEEDVKHRRSVSESIANRIAAVINFINNRQHDKHDWHLNGEYSVVQLLDVGDGVFICQEPMEIIGYHLYSGTSGGSGATIVDLRHISSDGTDNGTIFLTKPQVNSSSANKSFSHSNIRAASDEIASGHTKGVFSKTNFDRHDGILLKLDSAMSGGEDLQLTIYFRPR